MKKRCALIIVMMLSAFAYAIAAKSIEIPHILITHARDCPVELRLDNANNSLSDFSYLITNKTEKDIEDVYLTCLSYSNNNVINKISLIGLNISIESNSTVQGKLNLSNFINETTTSAILIASRVIFEPNISTSPDNKKDVYEYWTFPISAIKHLNPSNIKSFYIIEGRSKKLNFETDAPCYFCQWCEEDALAMCGQSFVGGICKAYACTQSFNCSCLYFTCSFVCKNPDYCC